MQGEMVAGGEFGEGEVRGEEVVEEWFGEHAEKLAGCGGKASGKNGGSDNTLSAGEKSRAILGFARLCDTTRLCGVARIGYSESMWRPITFLLVLLAWNGAASGQCSSNWVPGGLSRGFDGPVYASCVWDPDGSGSQLPLLVVGGAFQIAGSEERPFLAAWNGSNWQSIGGPPNGSVRSLTVHDGALIIGGEFTSVGGVAAARIARWTGSSWSAVGPGFSQTVRALATFQGLLVAGGRFAEFGYAASWNGTNWSAIGAGLNGEVRAMFPHKGTLLIGGEFSARAVRWNGTTATPITTSGWRIPAVRTFVEWNGEVVMAGRPIFEGEPAVFRVMGTTAQSMSEGLIAAADVSTLHVHDGVLYCGGGVARALARWNGSNWTHVLDAFANYGDSSASIATLTTFDGCLIAGGNFGTAGQQVANHLARLTDGVWSALCDGPLISRFGSAFAGVAFRGDRVIGGTFHFTDREGRSSYHAVRFDGRHWHAMPGLGPGTSDNQPVIRHFVVHEDSLYAVGFLQTTNPTGWTSLARWDGGTWLPASPLLSGEAHAVAVHEDEFVLGGFFIMAGAPNGVANAVRLINGQWQILGTPPGSIAAMAVHNGTLYAGGPTLFSSGSPFMCLWTGSAWQPMAWPGGQVQAMSSHQGTLIAGGSFSSAPGQLGLARLEGDSWQWLLPGSGLVPGGRVLAMASSGSLLAIGGSHGTLTTDSLLAFWDGQELSLNMPLTSSGGFAPVQGLTWLSDGLWVEGAFDRVDQRASPAVARFGAPPNGCYADCDCSGTLSIIDFQCFIVQFAGGSPRANCDDSTGNPALGANDFQCFMNRFAAGCSR